MSKIRFYFVRHGTTDWNATKRLQGHLDTQLNAQGREEAQKVAEFLSSVPFDSIFSSDLTRCRATADEIRRYHKVPYHETKLLREGHAGILGGKKIRGTLRSEIHSLNALKNFFRHYGESLEFVHQRVWRAINEILSTIKGDEERNYLIVSHGGSIRMFLASIIGYEDLQMAAEEIKVANCSTSIVEYDNGEWEVVAINQNDYLK